MLLAAAPPAAAVGTAVLLVVDREADAGPKPAS